MVDLTALPGLTSSTELFLDARGNGRLLRVSRHEESGVLVISLWDTDRCIGTFRLALGDIPLLLETLGLPGEPTRGPDPVS